HQRAVLLLGAAERLLRPPSHHGGLLEIGHLLPQSDHLVDEVLFWAMLVSHPVTRGSVGLLPMETDEREGRTRAAGWRGRRVRAAGAEWGGLLQCVAHEEVMRPLVTVAVLAECRGDLGPVPHPVIDVIGQ